MILIKDGRIAEDPWLSIADGVALPLWGPVIVSLARWRAERHELLARGGRIGVVLASHEPPVEIADDLAHFDLVALEFPKFTDGRAYSSARILRERLGFAGELRAMGNVLRDQLAFMRRCGFDAFEVPGDAPAGQWIGALAGISVRYQPATGFEPTAQELRRHRQPVDDTAA